MELSEKIEDIIEQRAIALNKVKELKSELIILKKGISSDAIVVTDGKSEWHCTYKELFRQAIKELNEIDLELYILKSKISEEQNAIKITTKNISKQTFNLN